MSFNQLKERDHSYVMQSYGRFDVAIDHGKGATVWDVEGKEYIDFTSGIGVCCLGYGDEGWANAIYEQARTLGHISNLFYSRPYVDVAETLCKRTGMKRVFFGNSGAEANECAIKVARTYASDKYGEMSRPMIVTLNNSFHGRTITTLAATGQDVFHHHFGPFTAGFMHVPANSMTDEISYY